MNPYKASNFTQYLRFYPREFIFIQYACEFYFVNCFSPGFYLFSSAYTPRIFNWNVTFITSHVKRFARRYLWPYERKLLVSTRFVRHSSIRPFQWYTRINPVR